MPKPVLLGIKTCLADANNKECINAALILQKRYLSHHFEEEAKLANVHLIRAFIALGDYAEAKHYIDLYEECKYLKNNPQKVSGGMDGLYVVKGQYYHGIGKQIRHNTISTKR